MFSVEVAAMHLQSSLALPKQRGRAVRRGNHEHPQITAASATRRSCAACARDRPTAASSHGRPLWCRSASARCSEARGTAAQPQVPPLAWQRATHFSQKPI